jgi:DNA modification methylase
MEHIILASTRPGAIVFDPFMGSGSTGVAAVLNGRAFIGCEMDAKHFANASARIRKAETQPRLL